MTGVEAAMINVVLHREHGRSSGSTRSLRVADGSVVVALAFMLAGSVVTPASAVNDLGLTVPQECRLVRPGDTVTVTLDVSDLTAPINGVQALMHYDTRVLRLTGVGPGAVEGRDWAEAYEIDRNGDVAYVVALLAGSTSSDHTVATLTFTAVSEGETAVRFRPDDPPLRSKLTRAASREVFVPSGSDSDVIVVTAESALSAAEVQPLDESASHPGAPAAGIESSGKTTDQSFGSIATVSEWGIVVMTLLFITVGTVTLHAHVERGTA